jgi:hypothetical protein
MMTLPASYKEAFWRNTTSVDLRLSAIGIGFTLADGDTLRLRLSRTDCRSLIETLQQSLDRATDSAHMSGS